MTINRAISKLCNHLLVFSVEVATHCSPSLYFCLSLFPVAVQSFSLLAFFTLFQSVFLVTEPLLVVLGQRNAQVFTFLLSAIKVDHLEQVVDTGVGVRIKLIEVVLLYDNFFFFLLSTLLDCGVLRYRSVLNKLFGGAR